MGKKEKKRSGIMYVYHRKTHVAHTRAREFSITDRVPFTLFFHVEWIPT